MTSYVFHKKESIKGPVIIYVGGGGESLGGPGLFFSEKRSGPKENFTMIGGGSFVCFVKNHTHYNNIHVEDLNKF